MTRAGSPGPRSPRRAARWHVVGDDTAALLPLADQACLTPHRRLSRTGRAGGLGHPDRLVFDLAPPGDDFAAVRQAAGWLHELLDQLGLPAAPMTAGSRGLHPVVPLDGRLDFDEVRRFAHDVAEFAQAAHPDRLTTAARKRERGDRLCLDVRRDAQEQTAVAPYAVRALPGAPSPCRSPGSRWTIPASTPAAGPSPTPSTRPAPAGGPIRRAEAAPADPPGAGSRTCRADRGPTSPTVAGGGRSCPKV
ncbi:hypothetical protein ACIRU3_29100 [Streptomyces sp. NPDC101151]|uniref:non-homologous end-joining DNA ligase LigD n=1 Tax=Streptomyces sp. NPDC101151 TaxID=3366115 RepID=UPI003802F7DC